MNSVYSKYPECRMRRGRSSEWVRAMLSENILTVNDLIWPVFVKEGKNEFEPVQSMPGVNRLTIDLLVDKVKEAKDLGIPAIAIFPVVEQSSKTLLGEESYNENNLICRAVREIKSKIDGIGVICDVALDPYLSHGQDGIVRDGKILNDETIEILCKQSLVQAEAGCDIIAPSDMMDGRVGAIRASLDSSNYEDVCIMSYAAKYASSFYGPFRDAVGSSSNLGTADKKTYQMNPANSAEAIREVELDISEGADIIMVKPALPYLDIVRNVTKKFNIPTFAYQVSGEYAMIKAAEGNGWINGNDVMMESLLSLKRAGVSGIFTYGALSIAKQIG